MMVWRDYCIKDQSRERSPAVRELSKLVISSQAASSAIKPLVKWRAISICTAVQKQWGRVRPLKTLAESWTIPEQWRKGARRKNSEEGRVNASKLIERCMKWRAIGSSPQLKLLPDSNCTLNHQDSEIFNNNTKPQGAWKYMFLSIVACQDFIDIIRDTGFKELVNIHEGWVGGRACVTIN